MRTKIKSNTELYQAQTALQQVSKFLKNKENSDKYKKSLYKSVQEMFNIDVKRSFNEMFDEQMQKMIEGISRFDFSIRFEIIDNPALEHVASYLNRLNEELEIIAISANMTDALQATSPDAGIFITNGTGKIRRVNAKTAQLLEIDENTLKGIQISTLFKNYHFIEEQLKKQSIIKNLPVQILSKNTEIPVFLNIFKSTNSVGEVEGLLYSIETELYFDKEINYRMAAHDLIGPLCTQFTLLGILKDEYLSLLKRLNTTLPIIDSLTESNNESIKRSKAALANNIKKNPIEQPIDFKQLINSIIHLLGITEQCKDVEILINISSKRAFYNNVSIVQSILQNLIQNAVKYRKPDQKNQISISVNDTKIGVEVAVKDTGIGINRNLKNQLFKDVVSSDPTKGHGFGLYGVAKQIEKLNGTIKVKSTLNIGSTFTVNLPTLIAKSKHIK